MKVYRFKDDYHVNRWRFIAFALAFCLTLAPIVGLIWLWGIVFALVSLKYYRSRVLSEGIKLRSIKDRYLRCRKGLRIYILIFCEMAIVLGLPLMLSIIFFRIENMIWGLSIDDWLIQHVTMYILGHHPGANVLNYSAIAFLYAYSFIFILSFFMWCKTFHVLVIPLLDSQFISRGVENYYSPWDVYEKIWVLYIFCGLLFLYLIFWGDIRDLILNGNGAFLFVPYMIFFAFLNSVPFYTYYRAQTYSILLSARSAKKLKHRQLGGE